MKKVMKLVLASLLFGGSAANAALVDFSLIGLVSSADSGNAYGLAASDQIFADGFYDDTGLIGVGNETLLLNVGGGSLLMGVGVASFTELDDATPGLMFVDGVVIGLNFLAPFDGFGTFTSNGNFFWGDDDPGLVVQGNWSNNTSPVPVPAAIWLFGSGLLGLVGVARRRKAV
ncbi:hypothetical protein MNBD_GAMMA15-1239 [hydrothermal vent metagenome]|uniref:Ice-binding protein C-terminal domain-containing protein n=1 Tax=hydrothermal vent metagenome TaxID=652676 RepID=A0A3B0ZF60_9ZZZZ